ncbi:DUF3667 domain-containing protein [Novilysobacter defluvii]|uniref:Membrane protein n=1 Tax=Lysobacter defluvii IMMIB APB-9 = DSM 18482 TaxID=1385515 RepID=A0A0A0MC35_9GAMM|nr:DUF3667 domain-containing protein [Lysobacter defluvii]KGO99631.1 membrane protein [Lysobacter defluvii IMMIB APB-9 = DSM 18482]
MSEDTITDPGGEPIPPPAPRCENCAAPLQGPYCHDCGQSVHNPVRHLGHAVEEFFEAFWHLDGRVFRTLRDLWVPGLVAINYLAGHRARYIAPLRLFVILSVLTFFIGTLAVHVDGDVVQVSGVEEIAAAGSVEEVEAIRDRMLGELAQARSGPDKDTPALDAVLATAEGRLREAAARRARELGTSPDGAEPVPTGSRLRVDLFGHRGDWDAETNPMRIGWLPGFANDWLNRRIGNLQANMQSGEGFGADTWLRAIMSGAPTALFLLVPVLALMLKVAYLNTPRLYLEHLVVALYSHVFLLLMLLLAFLLLAVGEWIAWPPLHVVLNLLLAAAFLWMPAYLLLMQKAVYGESWWLTALKYLVVGGIYLLMLIVATLLLFLGQLTSG